MKLNDELSDAVPVVLWLLGGVLSLVLGEHVVAVLLFMAAGIWRIGNFLSR